MGKLEIIEEIESGDLSNNDLQDIIQAAQYQSHRVVSMQKFQEKVKVRENPSFWSVVNPFSSVKRSWKRSIKDMKDQIKESKEEQTEKMRDYYDSKLNRRDRRKK